MMTEPTRDLDGENVPTDQRQRVFLIAEEVALAPESQRQAILAAACGADKKLAKEVQELLDEAFACDKREDDWIGAPKSGQHVDRYRLLEEIGSGGFGEVWMADQLIPVKRRVAIKFIKPGMDSGQVLARFEAERQALALMNHANIARVFDAGTTEQGRPFFVMELVKGVPITDFCREAELSLRERVELMRTICGAIQHAHHKGVIHRDLKPGNVLVGEIDGVAVPKVIDFGVAKALEQPLTDRTLFTEFRQFIGTPEYMSPEQTAFSMIDVDTRSDVYALGVLLYELLAGEPPFDPKSLRSAGFDEMRRIIREDEPPSIVERSAHSQRGGGQNALPRGLGQGLRGELDWIVRRAMAKERDRRYASAKELAEDLDRYLEGHAVVAGPPSIRYNASRFVRRHRVGVSVAAAALAVFVGVLALVIWDNVRIRAAQNETRAINEFLTEDLLAAAKPAPSAAQGGREVTVREALDIASAKVAESFSQTPAVEASVRMTLGSTYRSLGRLDEAEEQLREALRLFEREFGADDERAMHAKDVLTMTLFGQDKLDEVEVNLRSLFRQRVLLLGEEDLDTWKTQEGLAILLKRQGRLAEAREAYGRVLEAKRRLLGPAHRHTLVTLHNLAKLELADGELARAQAHALTALQHRQSSLERDHPEVLDSRALLIEVLIAQGDLEKAQLQGAAALIDFKQTFGPTHNKTKALEALLSENNS